MKKSKILYALIAATFILAGCAGPSKSVPPQEQSKTSSETRKGTETSAAQTDSAGMRVMTEEEKKVFRPLLDQLEEREFVLMARPRFAYEKDGKTPVTKTFSYGPMVLVNDPRFSNLEELKTWLGEALTPGYPAYQGLMEELKEDPETALYQEKEGKLYVAIADAGIDFSGKDEATYLISDDGQKAKIQMPSLWRKDDSSFKKEDSTYTYYLQKQGDKWLFYNSGFIDKP